jgi:signal peptidase I
MNAFNYMESFNQQQSTDDSNNTIAPSVISKNTGPGFVVEIFRFAVLALLIVVPFRMFIAQPFIVSGASMSPTFETGQYLIVDQLTYHLEPPTRGDVVIFRYPEDPSKFFIKRLIGLPGETVEMQGQTVSIRDPKTGKSTTLNEPYLHDFNTRDDYLTVTLGTEEYFVMGDNRGASSDSRVWGAVPKKLLVGRAFVRLLPVDKVSLFPGEHPTYTP